MAEMTHEERVSELLAEKLRKESARMAEYMAPPAGARRATSDKERELFWLRDTTQSEDDWWDTFGEIAMEQGIPPDQVLNDPKVRNAIAAKLYPQRLAVTRAGERALDNTKMIRFVRRMLRQGPPDQPQEGVPTNG